MWPKAYKDYPKDTPLIKDKVDPSNGIVGCEMHDSNGWGETYHILPKPKKRGIIRTFLLNFFSSTPDKEKNL